MTKPTIEEWVKSVRAENQWDDDANTIEEELLKALRIIKHLMKAIRKLSNKDNWHADDWNVEHSVYYNGYSVATKALEKCQKEIEG